MSLNSFTYSLIGRTVLRFLHFDHKVRPHRESCILPFPNALHLKLRVQPRVETTSVTVHFLYHMNSMIIRNKKSSITSVHNQIMSIKSPWNKAGLDVIQIKSPTMQNAVWPIQSNLN